MKTRSPRGHLRRARPAAVAVLAVTFLIAMAPAANAATTYTSTALNATVSGATVTATTTIKASVSTSASLAGICARSGSGAHYDFPLSAATLTTGGTSFSKARTFPAGTYTYQSCAKVGGVWNNIGSTKTFTVGATGTPSGSANPSGVAMPVGNLSGWKQVFTDDFTTNVSGGSFPGTYAKKWTGYDGFTDSAGIGAYDVDTISVSGGAMDIHLRTVNGKVMTAAPAPIVTTAWKGQTYGRYTIRFKADAVANFKAAWLLWPDSNNWNQGEVNFPEGELNSKMMGYNHCINDPVRNCYWFDSATQFSGGWHTATIEWIPGKITFNVDGKTGSTTSNVPSVPLHWVLQTETSGGRPSSSASGHILIDWVSVYTYTG